MPEEKVSIFAVDEVLIHVESICKGSIEKMAENNRRMLTALIVVSVALVVAIAIFVAGYTVNNNRWMNYVDRLQGQYEEMSHGADVQIPYGSAEAME